MRSVAARGVFRRSATDTVDNAEDSHFGRAGKQKCANLCHLARPRVETADDEFAGVSLAVVKKAKDGNKPNLIWLNPSRTRMFTHLRRESRHLAANTTIKHALCGSGVVEHDRRSTANGSENNSRRHGGATAFRVEKLTTYQGGVRVPMKVRRPGHIPAGLLEGIQTHWDRYATLSAVAGADNVGEKMRMERMRYIDGVDNLGWWTGKAKESARHGCAGGRLLWSPG